MFDGITGEILLSGYLSALGEIFTFVTSKITDVVTVIVSNPPLLVPFGIIVTGAVIRALKKIF